MNERQQTHCPFVVIKSECKLVGGANDRVEKEYFESFLPTPVEYVDVHGMYSFLNEEDTVVFRMPSMLASSQTVRAWMNLVQHVHCNEFESVEIGTSMIIRMWWD